MLVTPIKTPVVHVDDDLFEILKNSLPTLKEQSVVAITSKIVALCESSVVEVGQDELKERKHELIREQAELYTEPHSSKYDVMLTVKNHVLAVSAGIDESNTGGYYVLWPQDPQTIVNRIWQFLRDEYSLKEIGVVLTDSKTFPLKWGVVGTCIGHCGFEALVDKRGTSDLFGRELKMTTVNVAEGVAGAAVLEMGEGNESTPLAIVEEVTHIQFQDHVPSEDELAALINTLEDDVYAPILQSADWKKGGGGK